MWKCRAKWRGQQGSKMQQTPKHPQPFKAYTKLQPPAWADVAFGHLRGRKLCIETPRTLPAACKTAHGNAASLAYPAVAQLEVWAFGCVVYEMCTLKRESLRTERWIRFSVHLLAGTRLKPKTRLHCSSRSYEDSCSVSTASLNPSKSHLACQLIKLQRFGK